MQLPSMQSVVQGSAAGSVAYLIATSPWFAAWWAVESDLQLVLTVLALSSVITLIGRQIPGLK